MKTDSSKIGLGKIGEIVIDGVTRSLFKVRDGFRVKHIDWDNYTYGSGLDVRVFERNKQILAIEVKNWNWQDRPYGLDIVRREIIDRFKNFSGGIKVLIITFLCLLTSEGIELIKSRGIEIIEVGTLITTEIFKSSIFYQIKAKLASLWNRRTQILKQIADIKQSRLNKYINSNNNNNSNTNNHLTYDTEIPKLLKFLHKIGVPAPAKEPFIYNNGIKFKV